MQNADLLLALASLRIVAQLCCAARFHRQEGGRSARQGALDLS
jgi:hypothetical protein